MGQHGGSDQCAVLDADTVEDLQPFAQAAEDGDRVLHVRFLDHHRLEPAFQGSVLLDVLAVLIEGGGTDEVQLPAGEHRLEHVAGVHRPFGGSRPHQGVELVDEQQDASLRCLHLRQDCLHSLLELAPVLRAGDQGRQVQREHGLVAKALGHVLTQDPLGKALHDGGLSDTGLADEDGVVLGLAGEDLDDPADLRITPDDRVKLAQPGVSDQVTAVLRQRLVRLLGGRGVDVLVAADLGECAEEALPGDTVPAQHAGRGTVGGVVDEGQNEMLHGDVGVFQPLCLPLRPFQGGGEAAAHVHLTGLRGGPGDAGLAGDLRFDVGAYRFHVSTRCLQQSGNQPLLLLQQCEQEMLLVRFDLTGLDRDALGRGERFLRLLSE